MPLRLDHGELLKARERWAQVLPFGAFERVGRLNGHRPPFKGDGRPRREETGPWRLWKHRNEPSEPSEPWESFLRAAPKVFLRHALYLALLAGQGAEVSISCVTAEMDGQEASA